MDPEESLSCDFLSCALFQNIPNETLLELVQCPLLPHLLTLPIRCPVCDAHFCTDCLSKAMESDPRCPLCRTEFTEEKTPIKSSKLMGSLLDSIVLKCENHPKGCLKTFNIRDKEGQNKHILEECKFTPVQCSLYLCEEKAMRCEMKDHENECCKKKIACIYCLEEFERGEMIMHMEKCSSKNHCKWCSEDYSVKLDENHENLCDMMKVFCVACREILIKKDFPEHKIKCNTIMINKFMQHQHQQNLLAMNSCHLNNRTNVIVSRNIVNRDALPQRQNFVVVRNRATNMLVYKN